MDGHPPRQDLIRGSALRKPRHAMLWGKKDVSHDYNTPGARIGQGYHPINLGMLFPKEMDCWNALGG